MTKGNIITTGGGYHAYSYDCLCGGAADRLFLQRFRKRIYMGMIHDSVYLAPGSVVIKNVSIGAQSSVWFNAVVRGDGAGIRIGNRCNVQDNAVIHTAPGLAVVIGDGVTIGHLALLHGCTVGDNTLIGMGAIVMNEAVIGSNCIIGAGSLVTGGTVIPDGSLVMGRPAKVIRQVSEEQIRFIHENSDNYVKLMQDYKAGYYRNFAE